MNMPMKLISGIIGIDDLVKLRRLSMSICAATIFVSGIHAVSAENTPQIVPIKPITNVVDLHKVAQLSDKSKQLRLQEKQEQFKAFNFLDISKFPGLGGFLFISEPRITFNDAGRTLCHYRNNFFERSVRGFYEYDGDTLQRSDLDPPFVDEFGNYFIDKPIVAGTYTLTVDCDGKKYSIPVTVADPNNFKMPDIKLNNTPPVIAHFEAVQGGVNVVGVSKNSVVTLTATVSDPNGDALSFAWGANAGKIISSSGNTARWRLPNSGGLNFAYVLVTDGKGAYVERSVVVSTDGGTVAGSQLVQPSAVSDKVPRVDHFLTFFSTKDRHSYLPHASLGADSKMGSCRYYAAIGAATGCDDHGNLIGPLLDFTTWKKKWGLDNPAAGSKAIYANKADLNLQRNMHGISNAKGTAYYVCNYPRVDNLDTGTNLDNARHNRNLVACVAMEYSPTPGVNGNNPFTKFLVFAPSGSLLQSVNLDTRGEKYVPGSCVVCHGAHDDFTRVNENGSTSPELGAQFLPFDLDNFAFASVAGLTRSDQEAQLRSLNKLLLNTNINQTTKDAIAGWYPTPTSNFNSSFVPAGWAGHAQLYNDVVKPYCRTCHVAMPKNFFGDDLSFPTFAEFNKFNFELGDRVCGDGNGVSRKRYSMPNSLVTFNRFWGSPVARVTLRQHLIDQGEFQPTDVCSPPH